MKQFYIIIGTDKVYNTNHKIRVCTDNLEKALSDYYWLNVKQIFKFNTYKQFVTFD